MQKTSVIIRGLTIEDAREHAGRGFRFLLLTAIILPALLAVLARPGKASAQSADVTVLRNEALVNFPETVTFQLELAPGSQIVEADLTYQLGRDSCLAAGTQVPVEVSGPVVEWTWIMSRSGNPPPGATLWWEWTVTDANGQTFTTPREELVFSDERFDWRTVETQVNDGATPVRLHWYEGDEVGPTLLDAAVAGLNRLQQDTGLELQGDVQFYIYGSAEDMREALLYVQDWAGGVAFSEYNTILIGVPPRLADSWGSSTVRHELAHLVIGQFGRSCLGGSRPTWLEEGLATYAEGEPDDQILNDLEQGIEDNSFQPVRSLNGAFPARSKEATAAYSQSFSLVDYLLDTYGQEKIQELILILAQAEDYDEALERVYGFNADGLETLWREGIGAPPRQIPPTPTPISAASVPTVVPLAGAQSMPAPTRLAATAAAQPDESVASELEPGATATASPVPSTSDRQADAVVDEPTEIAPSRSPDSADEQSETTRSLCGAGVIPLFFVTVILSFRLTASRKRDGRY